MADVVILRYLFTFLCLNFCSARLLDYDNVEQEGTPSIQADNHSRDDLLTNDKMMMVQHPRYKCHHCVSPNCGDSNEIVSQLCDSALSCFKATVRTADGALLHSRGCSTKTDHYQFMCRPNQSSLRPRKRRPGQMNITCCQGDMCNDGSFPSLSPSDSRPIWNSYLDTIFMTSGIILPSDMFSSTKVEN